MQEQLNQQSQTDHQRQMQMMQQQMAQMQQMQMMQSQAQMTKSKGLSRTTAILLAFFLGGVGGHKFYLGQVGLGILYLFFFWTFIPAFVAFIELIVLLTQSDEKFDRQYNYG